MHTHSRTLACSLSLPLTLALKTWKVILCLALVTLVKGVLLGRVAEGGAGLSLSGQQTEGLLPAGDHLGFQSPGACQAPLGQLRACGWLAVLGHHATQKGRGQFGAGGALGRPLILQEVFVFVRVRICSQSRFYLFICMYVGGLMCVFVFTCTCAFVNEYGNQRSTLTLVSQVPAIFLKMLLCFNFFCVHVFMSGDRSVPRNTQESQRTTWVSLFSFSSLWGAGIALGFGGVSLFSFSLAPPCFMRQSLNGTWGLPCSQGWLAREPP